MTRIDGWSPAPPPVTPGAAPAAAAPGTASAGQGDDLKLRQAARQLTGLFAQQLFKAMRATVPTDQGVVSGGSGEEMFTGLLDEHLAGASPGSARGATARDSFTQGLADVVYRRLRAHAAPAAAPTTGPHAAAAVTPAPTPASLAQPTPLLLGPIDRR